ncbi:hypothetical protein NJ76_13915 [Rhodococcus sp. IITR03]|nr:hypothetical protein NJ76_13915 [Rhodococcus sp. IITR03]
MYLGDGCAVGGQAGAFAQGELEFVDLLSDGIGGVDQVSGGVAGEDRDAGAVDAGQFGASVAASAGSGQVSPGVSVGPGRVLRVAHEV